MSSLDPRFGITIPALGDLADITAVRDALLGITGLMAAVSGGTFAARPAAGTFGRFYRATTADGAGSGEAIGTVSFDNGAAWQALNPIDAAAATASLRTLGTTATSAAAGNDPRLLAGEQGTKAPVRAVHTSNIVNVANPGTMTYGGIVCVAGDRILLAGQTSSAENGVWIVGASSSTALVRAADMAAGSIVAGGCTVTVSESTVAANVDSGWMVTTNDTSIVVGTDPMAWSWSWGAADTGRLSTANAWAARQTFAAAPVQAVQAFTATGAISATGGKVVTFAGAAAQALTLPAAVVGMEFDIHNIDDADGVTLARAGADTLNGLTSLYLTPGSVLHVKCVAAGVWVAEYGQTFIGVHAAAPFMWAGTGWIPGGVTPTIGSGLNVNIAAGTAMIGGFPVGYAGGTFLMTASQTAYLYATLVRTNGVVTGITFTKNTTGILPAESALLAKVVTGASTVTSVTDMRIQNGLWLPKARVYRAAALSPANGVSTTAFDTQEIDAEEGLASAVGMVDLAVNNDRITCKRAGRVIVTGCAEWSQNAAGTVRFAQIIRNGVVSVRDSKGPNGAGDPTGCQVTHVYEVQPGDYFGLALGQNTGGALAITPGATTLALAVQYTSLN